MFLIFLVPSPPHGPISIYLVEQQFENLHRPDHSARGEDADFAQVDGQLEERGPGSRFTKSALPSGQTTLPLSRRRRRRCSGRWQPGSVKPRHGHANANGFLEPIMSCIGQVAGTRALADAGWG